MGDHACRQYAPMCIVSVLPDVCLTPCGAAWVSIPYIIMATGPELANTSPNVKMTSCPAATLQSTIPSCYGDQQGTGGGVVSGTTGSVCEFGQHRPDININQRPAVTQTHWSYMNARNTIGINLDSLPKISPDGMNAIGDVVGLVKEGFEAIAEKTFENLGDAHLTMPGNSAYASVARGALNSRIAGQMAGPVGALITLDSVLTQPTPEKRLDAAAKEIVKMAAVTVLVAGGMATLPAAIVVTGGAAAIEYGPGAIKAFIDANNKHQQLLAQQKVNDMIGTAAIRSLPVDSAARQMACGFGLC